MTMVAVVVAAVCLAYANGANDNFKGVATLFGSRTTGYRQALGWATAWTLLGSLAAVMLATTLLKKFTGIGLVSAETATTAEYGAAVALGAGLTVLLATRIGMPISTTHSLVGALLGAAWASGAVVDYDQLSRGFFAPLIASPLMAITATLVLYPLFRLARGKLGIEESTCVCVADGSAQLRAAGIEAMASTSATLPLVSLGTMESCGLDGDGTVRGTSAAGILDRLHFLSAGIVSFARGLNDTPKIAALLLLVPAIEAGWAIVLVGLIIAAGGILSARRVAETMSDRITEMNHGQGFTANLVTGLIVIGASRLGLPVSTTHVSCGSLFGIGTVTGRAHWRTIGTVLLAWAMTLPVGAAAGAGTYLLLGSLA